MVNSTSVEIEAGIERKRSKVGHFRSNYQKEEKLLNVDEEKHIPRRHKKAFIQKKFMNFDSMMMLDINNNNTNNTNITLPFKGMKIMTNSSGIGINETGLYPDGMEFTDNIVFDMKMKDQYKRYTKCRDKVGLLYHLQNGAYKDPNNTAITKNGLFSRPTLVVCSQSSFSIQDNLTPQSLLRAIQLPKILRVTQTYKGTTCFDVIEEGKESNPLSLCAESKSEMDEWIVSILEFKECLLKDKFELVDANSNAFAKKPSKEDIRNGRGMVPQEEIKKKLNLPFGTKETPVKPFVPPDALYYTNTFAPTSETLEITETDKTLTRILNDRKREELAQRQIKREVEDKIRKVKEAHKKIALQERKLAHQNAINKKKLIAAATKKIEDKTKAALKNILSDALKNMNKLGKKDIEQYKVTLDKPIIEEKKRTTSQVTRMMKMAEASKVDQPFEECLDHRLEGFKDKKYIKDTCQKFYGEDLCETCEQKDNFCEKCCTHRIGSAHVNHLAKCKVQCNALIE